MSASRPARKFFLCTGECVKADQLAAYPNSHVIGELRYVVDDGQRLTALAVYEISLASNIVPPGNVRIRVEIIGDARRIKCTVLHCEHFFKCWKTGRDTLLQLSQHYQL